MALNRLGSVFAPDKLTQLKLDSPSDLTATDDDGLRSFVAKSFNVPKDSLEVVSDLKPDSEGFSHAELRQVYNGVPVLGCTVKVHVEKDQHTVYAVTGALAEHIKLDSGAPPTDRAKRTSSASSPRPTKTISANTAAAIIMEHLAPFSSKLSAGTSCSGAPKAEGASGVCMHAFGAAPESPVETLSEAAGPGSVPMKQIVRTEDGDKLVWYAKVHISDAETPAQMHVMVDAYTGSVLQSVNLIPTLESPADGVGESFYSGDVPLSTTSYGNGKYQMKDLSTHVTTCDMGNRQKGPCRDIYSADDHFGNHKITDRQTVAADVHFGLDVTNEYYSRVHGRQGIDGTGRATQGRVHYGRNYDNAFWTDEQFAMFFGDGSNDGTSCSGFLPLVSLAIIGHELTHGVTSSTAGLIYEKESGGLNEATSDIMGMAILEWAHENAVGKNTTIPKANFIMGAELMPASCKYIMRDMRNPKADGSSPSCWSPQIGDKDVHYSSGVGNRAFYLMTEGLNCGSKTSLPAALGFNSASKIWYRALTKYMTPTTNYFAARQATALAAGDLYGRTSGAVDAVNAAWDIVNVPKKDGVSPDTCQPNFATTPCEAAAQAEPATIQAPSARVKPSITVPEELQKIEAAVKILESCSKDLTVNIKCGGVQATI